MYYPTFMEDGNTSTMITTWRGYNHNPVVAAGEFYDMENLSSDQFPLLSPRKIRPLLIEEENLRGLLYSENNICYLEGTNLHIEKRVVDLSDIMEPTDDWQTIIRFGAYMLFFPLGIYVNLYDDEDRGSMGARVDYEGQIKYSLCTLDGSDYDNVVESETAPENPTDGMYWLCTKPGETGLNIWYSQQSMWQPVATTYIRIEIPGAELTSHFAEGDAVFMDTTLDEVNDGSIIQCLTDDYLVVIALMDSVTRTEEGTLYIERKLPEIDHICADKNRLWACHYGYSESGKMVNEIYASKLGDFKNWYSYAGIATDSYSVSVGVPGEWTGCISYNGYPTFFKENAIFKIYGSYPAEYQILQNDQRGVQLGSHKSLAVIGETLFYKSPSDVCAYDGSSPTSISAVFGRDTLYYNAVGGGCLNKYHVEMEDALGRKHYFVYDAQNGLWEKETAMGVLSFSSSFNGQMYAATDTEIFGLGVKDNVAFLETLPGEEWVEWFAESGVMGYEYPEYKYVDRLTLRAFVPHRSEIVVSISYDDRPFEDVGTLRGNSEIGTQSLAINPYRCDHFKLRFSGHGDCTIYSLAIQFEIGSVEHGSSYR